MFTPDRFLSTRRKAGVLALVLGGSLAVCAALPASAMDAAAAQAHRRDQQDKDDSDSPPPRREERREERPARVERPARSGDSRPTFQAAPGQQAPARPDSRGGDYRGSYPRNRNGDPVVVGPPRGPQGPDARIVPPSRAYGYNRPPPPERVVPRLPPGYRSYNWGGSQYYNHGGRWYRPYGSSYVVIGAPYGLFVPYLPGYYSTFWFGGSRYYMADDTYYLYEPQRRGYVVTRSPYGDHDDEEDTGGDQRDSDLYVYPMRGQSEKQQADDRYECHRWAADQTHYDPIDSDYRSDEREKYDRAITACLTGRGYSVK